MIGRVLCALGFHKVRNRHYLSPGAWMGPCSRKGCKVEVMTKSYRAWLDSRGK